MTYTLLAVASVAAVLVLDLAVVRTRLVTRRGFWTAYGIVLFFQLLVNGVLSGLRLVRYDDAAIIGTDQPRLLGDGRIVYAPVEDLLFGFALVTVTLSTWIWLGRRGVDR